MENHDPVQQENYLRQCLANGKRPIGILLGAGAPMSIKTASGDPLIPDVRTMTKMICDELEIDTLLKDSYTQLCAQFACDGISSPNIEVILSYIRALKQIAGKGNVRGFVEKELSELETTICSRINTLVSKSLPSMTTPYHSIATWINSIDRQEPVELFTTNYDLLMEQSLEDSEVTYYDGFSGSRYTFFDTVTIEDDNIPPKWARLWKLHGSINWFLRDKKHVYRSISPSASGDNQVIYPSHLKYDESRKLPYLAMLDRLKAFLKKQSSIFITCGYSFKDFHINEVIFQSLKSNPSAMMFGLLYGKIDNYLEAVERAKTCANFNLLAFDEAVIGVKKLPWPERDPTTSDIADSTAVKWISTTTQKRAEFVLGNFAQLGEFFSEIVGTDEEP